MFQVKEINKAPFEDAERVFETSHPELRYAVASQRAVGFYESLKDYNENASLWVAWFEGEKPADLAAFIQQEIEKAEASVEEIDRLNILHATMLAMRRAVQGLRLKPTKVLVDGNRIPPLDVLAEAIVKGDAKVPAISAASILAKVHRDRWCAQVHDEFPQYGFAGHKGYGTAVHMAALREHGACIHHRRSFAPVAQNLRAGS